MKEKKKNRSEVLTLTLDACPRRTDSWSLFCEGDRSVQMRGGNGTRSITGGPNCFYQGYERMKRAKVCERRSWETRSEELDWRIRVVYRDLDLRRERERESCIYLWWVSEWICKISIVHLLRWNGNGMRPWDQKMGVGEICFCTLNFYERFSVVLLKYFDCKCKNLYIFVTVVELVVRTSYVTKPNVAPSTRTWDLWHGQAPFHDCFMQMRELRALEIARSYNTSIAPSTQI